MYNRIFHDFMLFKALFNSNFVFDEKSNHVLQRSLHIRSAQMVRAAGLDDASTVVVEAHAVATGSRHNHKKEEGKHYLCLTFLSKFYKLLTFRIGMQGDTHHRLRRPIYRLF